MTCFLQNHDLFPTEPWLVSYAEPWRVSYRAITCFLNNHDLLPTEPWLVSYRTMTCFLQNDDLFPTEPWRVSYRGTINNGHQSQIEDGDRGKKNILRKIEKIHCHLRTGYFITDIRFVMSTLEIVKRWLQSWSNMSCLNNLWGGSWATCVRATRILLLMNTKMTIRKLKSSRLV